MGSVTFHQSADVSAVVMLPRPTLPKGRVVAVATVSFDAFSSVAVLYVTVTPYSAAGAVL